MSLLVVPVSSHAVTVTVSVGERMISGGTNALESEGNRILSQLAPGYSMHAFRTDPGFTSVEVRAGVRTKGRLSGGTGLRIDRQGYSIGLAVAQHDPDRRFDRWTTFKEENRLNVISVPVWLGWDAGRRVSLAGGITLGFPLSSGGRTTFIVRDRVYVNGEREKALEQSSSVNEDDLNIPVRGFVPGAFTSVRYGLNQYLGVDIGAWLLGNPLASESRSSGGRGLSLSLSYKVVK